MLLLLSILFAAGGEPPTIVVSDTIDEEIYFQDPVVLCDDPCQFENDTSMIFVQANSKHRSWFKKGKVRAVYNDESVKINYPDCNFKVNAFKCANETGMWVMKTNITIDDKVATISILLFDEYGVVIGQSTITSNKKKEIIEREKVVEQNIPGPLTTITNCDPKLGRQCASMPMNQAPITIKETEDLEPTIIRYQPVLSARDIQQAMIMLYDSVL